MWKDVRYDQEKWIGLSENTEQKFCVVKVQEKREKIYS